MRKVEAAMLAAKKTPVPAAAAQTEAAVRLVCLALTLSMVALAWRIFSVW